MKWSEEAWRQAMPVYRRILGLPFVGELADGSLSRERFLFYLSQDAIYIENYSRVLAHIASRLPRQQQCADFLRFAADGIAVEQALHASYLNGITPAVATPTCLLYSSYESSLATAPVEVEAAAILPCFQVYQAVGEDILARATPDNPYYRWISTYGDEAFAASTLRAIEICDELAEAATPGLRRAMSEAFLTSTRMEWMFWDSAYNLEKWKI